MAEEPHDDPAIDVNAPAPASYVNWRLLNAGWPLSQRVEADIYTDTWIIGEYQTGPLKFMNTIAHGVGGRGLQPAIVLRFSCYWPAHGYKPIEATQDRHYHAGDYFDEVAALASLMLGIRAQAGPITREFRVNGDPLGNPIMIGFKATPTLVSPRSTPIVPRLDQAVNLVNLRMIEKFPTLSAELASVVVKVARMYQSALWFADSHPEMSWILLVSAIEAAAGDWAKKNHQDAEPILPERIMTLIKEHQCAESIVCPLAEYLSDTTRSTRKFLTFLKNFLPDPPENRPEAEALRVDFESPKLFKELSAIYGYRSRALHDGIPFPYPMCLPPTPRLGEERHFALGISARNATWAFGKSKPMLFYMFEHIARGALLKWMNSL